MIEINMETWKRKEHFQFFKNVAYPIYNICFDVDVTKLLQYTKESQLSFHLAMVFLTTSALNQIENFKYRLRGETVVLHEFLTPSFADLGKGDDLFKMVTVEMENTMKRFIEKAVYKSANQKDYFVVSDFANRDDFVFYSSLPWITFTSIDHTINLKKEDAIPRVSWGKYYRHGEVVLMPFNIQVNHLFVDGVHLGKFKEILDDKLSHPNS